MIRDPEGREREILASFVDLTDKIVLEVGCGTGHFTKILAEIAWRLLSIDDNADCIAEIKKSFSKEKYPHVSFANLPLNCLVSSDNLEIFSVVIFTFSFHETGDQLKALNDAYSLIEDGGQIIVIEPKHEGEICQFFSSISLEFSEEKIMKSADKILREFSCKHKISREFEINWKFTDKQDLRDSSMAIMGKWFSGTKEELEEIIADKIAILPEHEPIILVDKIIVWSLIK